MLAPEAINRLALDLQGTLHVDNLTKSIYATDASAYQETPTAVVIPISEQDLQLLVKFAREHAVGLIPRTAGTSLAVQCVGEGIVIDFSKHFTSILSFNEKTNH